MFTESLRPSVKSYAPKGSPLKPECRSAENIQHTDGNNEKGQRGKHQADLPSTPL